MLPADDGAVRFRTRGDGTITVEPLEFIRRFLQHVLPRGFTKIRHYRLMASGAARSKRERARQPLAPDASPMPATGGVWHIGNTLDRAHG